MREGRVLRPEEWAELKVIAGDRNIARREKNDQVRKIRNVIMHPKYQTEAKMSTFDIAIVQLEKPYTYNQFVQPLPIGSPPVEAVPGGQFINIEVTVWVWMDV
jgi:hypothetical protein